MPKEGMEALRESTAINWLSGKSEDWFVSLCLWVTSSRVGWLLPHCRQLGPGLFWYPDCNPKAYVCSYNICVFRFKVSEKKWPTEQCIYRLAVGVYVACSETCHELNGRTVLDRARFGVVCRSLESEHATSGRTSSPLPLRNKAHNKLTEPHSGFVFWIHSKETPGGQRTPSLAMWMIRTQQQTRNLGYMTA